MRITSDGDDEFDGPDLAFDDLGRMTIRESHGPNKFRRLPTPRWATNDAELCTLIVRFFERRARICDPQGSLPERLRRARQQLLDSIPAKIIAMNNLCREFIARKDDPARRRVLAAEIENLDTDVVLTRRGPGVVIQIVFLYYRMGLTSCQIGHECNLKPPLVRQTLSIAAVG